MTDTDTECPACGGPLASDGVCADDACGADDEMLPDILNGLPIHWRGTDNSTPAGCELVVTTVVGIATTYLLRNGQVIGRIEAVGSGQNAYIGDNLKGGTPVFGQGTFYELAQKIAERA